MRRKPDFTAVAKRRLAFKRVNGLYERNLSLKLYGTRARTRARGSLVCRGGGGPLFNKPVYISDRNKLGLEMVCRYATRLSQRNERIAKYRNEPRYVHRLVKG